MSSSLGDHVAREPYIVIGTRECAIGRHDSAIMITHYTKRKENKP